MVQADQGRCKYNGGSSCPNKRAVRANGRIVLRVCEYHRRRANAHQKKYQQRKKEQTQATANATVSTPRPVSHLRYDAAPSPLVVYVVASEKTSGEASKWNGLRAGERFQAVSGDRLREVLDTLDRDTKFIIQPQDVKMTDVTVSVSEEPKIPVPVAPEPLDYSSDSTLPLLLDDFGWFSDFAV